MSKVKILAITLLSILIILIGIFIYYRYIHVFPPAMGMVESKLEELSLDEEYLGQLPSDYKIYETYSYEKSIGCLNGNYNYYVGTKKRSAKKFYSIPFGEKDDLWINRELNEKIIEEALKFLENN